MRSYTTVAVVLLVAGCTAESSDKRFPANAPLVHGFVQGSVPVGGELTIVGENFITSDFGWVDVTLMGEFVPADGSARQPVEFEVALQAHAADDEEYTDELSWPSFGAYRVPFGTGDQVGSFEGYISAENRYWDGSTEPSDPAMWPLARLDVEPSIVVLDMRAMGQSWVADCADPSTTLIGAVPYGMRIHGAGFELTDVQWHIGEGHAPGRASHRNGHSY